MSRQAAARTLTGLQPVTQTVVDAALRDVANQFADHLTAAAAVAGQIVAQGHPIDDADLSRIRTLWARWIPAITTALLHIYDAAAAMIARRFNNGTPPAGFADLPDTPTERLPQVVDDYLRAAENRLVAVGDDLWHAARLTLADGVADGEGYDQLRDRLRDTFAADGQVLGETRAERIARTETHAAWQRGAVDTTMALPDDVRPRYKQWQATLDTRTRDPHFEADGQIVPLEAPFEVGGELLMYPGDPAGSPGNVINCRCDAPKTHTDTPMADTGRQYLTDEQIAAVVDRFRRRGVTRPTAATMPATLDAAAGPWPGTPPTPGAHAVNHLTAAAHTGGMIALIPSAADRQRLTLPGGEPDGELHLTLAFLGEAADWTPEQQQAVVEAVTTTAPDIPLEAAAFGYALWNPDSDSPAWVLNVGGDGLDDVHGAVWEQLRNLAGEHLLPIPTQHTPWQPHVCLAYTGEDLAPQMRQRLGGITFDTLRVAFAGDHHDIPLTAAATAAAADGGDSGGRQVRGWHTPDPYALAFEDTQTGDGRLFAAGSLVWDPDGTLPLQYAEQMLQGHDGARLCGDIAVVARDRRRIASAGDLYTDTAAGAEVADLLERGSPLGVSVDVDDVTVELVDNRPPEVRDAEPLFASTPLRGLTASVLPLPSGGFRVAFGGLTAALTAAGINPAVVVAAAGDPDNPDGEVLLVEDGAELMIRFTHARLRGATLVSIPAFDQARIVLVDATGHDPYQTTTASTGPAAQVGELMAEVIDYVTAAAAPVRPGQVADALGITGSTARSYLSRAAAAGRLTRPHRGLYAAPAPAEATAAAVGNVDLPVHPDRDRPWDGPAAASRVLAWANEQAEQDGDEPPSVWLRQAFLWRDEDANPNTLSAYRLGFADVISGELRIVARGVFATAGGRGVDAADIPETGKELVRDRICALYEQLAEAFADESLQCPWRGDEQAAADPVIASAWAELQGLPPLPAAWFTEPTEAELPPGSGGVHVTDDGRIYGWVAQRGVPHDGHPGRHLTLDDLEPVDLSHFLRARLRLDSGSFAKVGAFTMNVGHHRDGAECETPACQFDDTRTVAGVVTVGLNARGMWFSGAAAPWLSDWDRLVFAACQPSYHMVANPDGNGYSLRAVLSVPRPGHPSRLAASAAVARGNLALTPATAAALPVVDVAQAVDVAALAAAVVDEQERRAQQRRDQAAQLRAEVDSLLGGS